MQQPNKMQQKPKTLLSKQLQLNVYNLVKGKFKNTFKLYKNIYFAYKIILTCLKHEDLGYVWQIQALQICTDGNSKPQLANTICNYCLKLYIMKSSVPV